MSLLGIDVGTSGCKAVIFTVEGMPLASAYEEYDVQRVQPGYAELDTLRVWEKVKTVIKHVAAKSKRDPIQALAVSSLGEAVVPVTYNRQVLGPSLLNFDTRGRIHRGAECGCAEQKFIPHQWEYLWQPLQFYQAVMA